MPSSELDRRAWPAHAEDEEREEITERSEGEASPSLPSAALAVQATAHAEPPARVRHDSYREIWTLSWPVMLSLTLGSAVALIDLAMVGRLGRDALAATGYATQFFFLAQASLFAVGFACVALMARAIGAGDPARARQALAASLLVAAATSLVVAGVVMAFPRPILGLLGASPKIIELTTPYMRLLMASSVLLSLSLTVESALRASKNTIAPMWIAGAVAIAKLILNWVLIYGNLGAPRLELVGAGLATLAAQLVALLIFFALVARARADSPIAFRLRAFARALPMLRDVVRLALPGVIERLVMNMAMLIYFSVLSRYGEVAVAVYTVGIRILSFSWIPGSGIATAAATLVGQSLGSDNRRGARRAGWRSARLSIGIAVVLGGICAALRHDLAALFTDDATIIRELGPFMLCLALAQPAMQLHFTLAGAHRGAGDTWTPLVSATVANWAFRVPLASVFAYVLELDLVWIWMALITDHVTRAAWLVISFRRGHWLSRYRPHHDAR